MKKLAAMLLCALCMFTTGAAMAAEIRVLSAGAVEPGLRAAAAAFQKQSGHDLKITFNTAPEIRKRIVGGDAFDVVIAPPAALDEFAGAGKVTADRVNVGRVGMGVAVRPGAPVPDISNADALKRSVLQAESIVFNRASSGIYFENLLKKMDIYEQVQAKTTRYADGAAVMEHVLKGKGREIGFGPVTEILQHKEKGLKLVGPLPAEVQNYTSYSAAPMTAAANGELARVFVRYLGSAEAKALLVAAGVD
jgi:molybdate transport system substrate-binding protein